MMPTTAVTQPTAVKPATPITPTTAMMPTTAVTQEAAGCQQQLKNLERFHEKIFKMAKTQSADTEYKLSLIPLNLSISRNSGLCA